MTNFFNLFLQTNNTSSISFRNQKVQFVKQGFCYAQTCSGHCPKTSISYQSCLNNVTKKNVL